MIKALIGAVIVILIQLISNTKNYYVAALIPLFPFFGLISYYIIGTERGIKDLKNAIVFGVLSLIPYFAFLVTLYFTVDRYRIGYSLIIASIIWFVIAILLIVFWRIFGFGQ